MKVVLRKGYTLASLACKTTHGKTVDALVIKNDTVGA